MIFAIFASLVAGLVLFDVFSGGDDDAPATADGQNGDDETDSLLRVDGTSGDDALAGGPEAEFFRGFAGNDLICANEGDDTVRGQDGNDLLIGNRGDDFMRGEQGNDVLAGLRDDDALRGGDGSDILLGGSGDDALYGGQGDDALIGGPGGDFLDGGSGQDVLIGFQLPGFDGVVENNLCAEDGTADTTAIGAELEALLEDLPSVASTFVDTDEGDSLRGGSGDDLLLAGANDTLFGGPNDDVFALITAIENDEGDTGPVTIEDYNADEDAIVLTIQTARFDPGGASDEDFFEVTSALAANGEDTEIYLNDALYATLQGVTEFDPSVVTRVFI